MKLQYKLNSKMHVVAEGENHLELFENLASLQEVFGQEKCCKCGGDNIEYRVRRVTEGKKEYVYPELVCRGYDEKDKRYCNAKFTFGQSDGGKLFPVRFERKDGEYVRDEDNKLKEKGSKGWVRYNKETEKEE